MRLYLPKSINEEIEHWQQYRKDHILPAIRELATRERHLGEVPVTIILDLVGQNYNMPLEVTGYRLRSFFPYIPPSIQKNLLFAKGMHFMKKSVEIALKKYHPTVLEASPNRDLLRKRILFNSEVHKTDRTGKIIGELISTPFKRKAIPDSVWFDLIGTFYKDIKNKRFSGMMSDLGKEYAEPLLRGKILDYAAIFALIIFYEESKRYFAQTPDKRALDVFFIDLKKQKEIKQ